MASIVLTIIGLIDYLAYGTIFTRATFRPKIKLDVFFLVDACQKVVGASTTSRRSFRLFWRGKKLGVVFSPATADRNIARVKKFRKLIDNRCL